MLEETEYELVPNCVGVNCTVHSHSYGEYVFDHSWANAYMMHGLNYYPKLQSCVPFTPVTGPRMLLSDKVLRKYNHRMCCRHHRLIVQRNGQEACIEELSGDHSIEETGSLGQYNRLWMN